MTDRYTHGHHDSVLRSHRWRTAENSAAFLLAHLAPGQSLLDVGCGPGTITSDLARRVGPGPVVGIDVAATVVDVAAGAYPTTDHPNLRFDTGDVYALEFDDESFDVVFAHQVLQHLSDPVAALREMGRVLRVGGLLAVRDADYGAFTWFPADPALDEWLEAYHRLTRENHAEADGGRHLPRWVRAAGFSDLTVTSSNWTYATDEERRWWGALWAERVTASDFAGQALAAGIASSVQLEDFANAFRRWARDPDGLFLVPSVEVLAQRDQVKLVADAGRPK